MEYWEIVLEKIKLKKPLANRVGSPFMEEKPALLRDFSRRKSNGKEEAHCEGRLSGKRSQSAVLEPEKGTVFLG